MKVLLLTLVALTSASATPCLQRHDGTGRWGWQIVDGRKCWFQLKRDERRGRDRNRNELFWERENYPPLLQMPWDLEGRWRGQ